jgi:hypothetical protein
VVAPGVHSNSVMENGPKEPDVFLGPIWPPDIKPVRGEVSLNKALPLKLDRLGELKPGVDFDLVWLYKSEVGHRLATPIYQDQIPILKDSLSKDGKLVGRSLTLQNMYDAHSPSLTNNKMMVIMRVRNRDEGPRLSAY